MDFRVDKKINCGKIPFHFQIPFPAVTGNFLPFLLVHVVDGLVIEDKLEWMLTYFNVNLRST